MTSDPHTKPSSTSETAASANQGHTAAASQEGPPGGSPLVDLVDTDSDDCELERKREEAAVVSLFS